MSDRNVMDLNEVDRYLAGEATPEESARVEQLAEASRVSHGVVQRLSKITYSLAQEADVDPIDTIHAWSRVHSRLTASQIIGNNLPSSLVDTSIMRQGPMSPHAPVSMRDSMANKYLGSAVAVRYWSIAMLTTIVLLIGVSIGVLATSLPWGVLPAPVPSMLYATGKAQRSTIQLADGTRVLLNVDSEIRIPENFSSGDRRVLLKGEAFFQVVPLRGRPFSVDAAGTRTEVLGTEFSVRAYSSETVSVAVKSGKVAVNDVVVLSQEVARVDKNSVVKVEKEADLKSAHSFINGRLLLEDVLILDAIPSLSRWYDSEIILGDSSLKSIRLTLESGSGTLGDLQRIFETAFALRVERNGRILKLFPLSI